VLWAAAWAEPWVWARGVGRAPPLVG
jgi:hypothetical protein